MPFEPRMLTRFSRGVVLVGQPDDVPPEALRVARNVRLDRVLTAMSSRPGSSQKTVSALAGIPIHITKLFGNSADFSYYHHTTSLIRLTDAWATPAVLSASVGATALTDATMPTGETTPVPYKYFAGASGPVGKDNGTTFSTWGIAPPTAAPSAIVLATDLSTTIDLCNAAASWTGGTLASGPSNETNIRVEGTGSVTFTIAADGLGSVSLFPLPTANLDTLTGGDNGVKADDYIHVWIRLDRPERLDYMQIDVDIDADTTGVADAFRDNFYSAVVSPADFSQGADQWTEVQVRKSAFQRYGTATARSWATAIAFRLRFRTTSLGILTVYMDDIRLRGGIDLEGDVEYTCYYENNTTKARGNPPKNSDGAVLWTSKLTTNRQRISVTTTNVIQGGANHPGDTQIDRLAIVRRGGQFPAGVRVESIADTTASPYVDSTSDATLLLSPIALEDDNDVPPTGATVVFGPGATNRLFLIVDGYRLRYSKAWQRLENRAEQFPLGNDAGIGDGSQRALAGLCLDTQIYAWTDGATYQIVGAGDEALLPILIPNSRGIVGTKAVASGDGRIFFVAQDGVYEQVGLQQRKLTGAIDPFFLGIAVDGNPALNTTASVLRDTRLEWHADPLGPMVMMLYAAVGSTTPNRQLIIKKHLETGQYTECFFDDHTVALRSLFRDQEDNELLAGASDSRVWQLEDHTVNTDAGASFLWGARTGSDTNGDPRNRKRYSQVVVEGDTNTVVVTPTLYYDKGSVTEAPGAFTTTTASAQALMGIADPTVRRRDIAMDLTATITDQVIISAVGWYTAPAGDQRTFWDSDTVALPLQQRLDRLEWEMEAPDVVSVIVYAEGVSAATTIMPATTGRQRVTFVPTTEIRARIYRVTMNSVAAFDMYTPAQSLLILSDPSISGTFWNSDRFVGPQQQRLDRLEFDLNAPGALTMTLYVDGTAQTAVTLAATSGRQRVTYIPTTELRARNFRVTLSSASVFQVFDPTDAIFVLSDPSIPGTFWNSDRMVTPYEQRLDRLELDVNAPSTLTLTGYVDNVARISDTILATSGRQRVTYVPSVEWRGRTFRLTLSSLSAFQQYQPSDSLFVLADPAMLGDFWDSGPLDYPVQSQWKWLEYDVDSDGALTITLAVNGVTRQTLTLPATQGRARGRLSLAPQWWGQLWRVTLSAPLAFSLYDLRAWGKGRGTTQGHQPQPLLRMAG